MFDAQEVQNVLRSVPLRYRGPGGAIAVIKDGDILGQHCWGYADMDRRIPMSPSTLFPVCSITKQFVSMLLLDLINNPPTSMTHSHSSFRQQFQDRLREVLPAEFVDHAGLTVENLVDMCSGLRDYWALCTLQGSRPDTIYTLADHNADMLRRIKSLQFTPGTEYSYSNTNFNVVERLIEHVANDSLDRLLTQRILEPAKMSTARICPRTDRLPAPIVGYEGSQKVGFFPAPNFIEWSADAGLVASLDDMIAYERYFDKQFLDSKSSYQELVKTRDYKDGAEAKYRNGLRHANIEDVRAVGHGGALRGYKLYRCYVEAERLSVVILFNHSANAVEAAQYIIKELLHITSPTKSLVEADQRWFGKYLDQETQLSVRIVPGDNGKIKITYSRAAETLTLVKPTTAMSPDVEAWIHEDSISIQRRDDNRLLKLQRLAQEKTSSSMPPVQGRYYCDETESTFICEGEGTMLYALFDGCYGRGPAHLMTHLGEDVWVFANPRAMDDQAPGDWTLVFERDPQGVVTKVTIGCWLARKLCFKKL